MRDKESKVIYIGKAKNLKRRVTSYFVGTHEGKTLRMIQNVDDFDIIVTNNDIEALLLEESLIKSYRPRFNISLTDDKTYPYLRLNRSGYPKLEITREKKRSSLYLYFGPYPNTGYARRMIALIEDSMMIQSKLVPNGLGNYHRINKTETTLTDFELQCLRSEIASLMRGKNKPFKHKLQQRMNEASKRLDYETANSILHDIKVLDYIQSPQVLAFSKRESFNMIGIYCKEGMASAFKFIINHGRVTNYEIMIGHQRDFDLAGFLQHSHLIQTKSQITYVPEESLKFIQIKQGDNTVKSAQIGQKKHLMTIACNNAKKNLEDAFKLALK